MTGKELIFSAFQNKELTRTPWIPYTGVQIGQLIGVNADELLKSENLLYESLLKAHNLYGPDAMPIIFDLQIEAEILGCELRWDEKAPPSVKTHPLSESKILNLSIPQKNQGRLSIVLNVMEKMKQNVGKETALIGLGCGPLTLAAHLRGMNFFMDMYEDEKFVNELIEFCSDVFIQISDYYIDAGMDIIAAVDPLVSQISPESFTQFLLAPYKRIYEHLRNREKYSGFFVCGDATKNLEVMCETGTQSISVDENIDIVEAKKITDKYNIIISGNIPLTTVMLHGNQKDNQKYAIELVEKMDPKNFILAPGCDMPYDIPPENIIGIAQAVQNTEAINLLLKDYKKEQNSFEVDLPDYKNLTKPLIEVYTIDSLTCAACSYMTLSAMEMKKYYNDKIDVIENKITEKENVIKINKIGLKNLPALLINGEVKYISIIPTSEELKNEIDKYL